MCSPDILPALQIGKEMLIAQEQMVFRHFVTSSRLGLKNIVRKIGDKLIHHTCFLCCYYLEQNLDWVLIGIYAH